jgi:hypothetical protein
MRIARIIDVSKCVLRVTNLQQAGFKLTHLTAKKLANPNDKKPEDFLSDYFPKDSDAFALAQTLCDPSVSPAPLIESFIDKKLYANQTTIDKKFG